MIIYVEHGASVVPFGSWKKPPPADLDRTVAPVSQTSALATQKEVYSRKDGPEENTAGRMLFAIRAGQAGHGPLRDGAIRR